MNEDALASLLIGSLRRVGNVYGRNSLFATALRWLLRRLGVDFVSGPTDLKTALIGDSIEMNWKPPKRADPAWDRYIVNWERVPMSERKEEEVDKAATNARLKQLFPGGLYHICVSMGDGSFMIFDKCNILRKKR